MMGESTLIIMLKDETSGLLAKEAAVIRVENDEYVGSVYAENADGVLSARVRLTAGGGAGDEDWRYDAILDYYDENVLNGLVDSFAEAPDCYDPSWDIAIKFSADADGIKSLEDRLNDILQIHKSEIGEVLETIKDKREEYM